MRSAFDRIGRWSLPMLAAAALAGCSSSERPPEAQAAAAAQPAGAVKVTVYKSPTCGCCKNWVEHMREAGFEVVAVDTTNMDAIKAEHGVSSTLQSCHTALADGYVFEGHVPADLIRKFLAERPAAGGLAVPGMPMGSPGMEGPYKDHYDILAFQKDGSSRVYESR